MGFQLLAEYGQWFSRHHIFRQVVPDSWGRQPRKPSWWQLTAGSARCLVAAEQVIKDLAGQQHGW